MDELDAHEQPRSFTVVLIDKLKPQLAAADKRLKSLEEKLKEDDDDKEGGEEQEDDGEDGEDQEDEPFEPDDDN